MLFFGFLSVLESVLPSLVSRTAPAALRGTAMGVYSSSQFFGAFIGGVLGGWSIGEFGPVNSLLILGVVCCVWLLVARLMKNPPKLKAYRLPVKESLLQGDASQAELHEKLKNVSGVREVSIVANEGAAYLKVMSSELDEQVLLDYSSN